MQSSTPCLWSPPTRCCSPCTRSTSFLACTQLALFHLLKLLSEKLFRTETWAENQPKVRSSTPLLCVSWWVREWERFKVSKDSAEKGPSLTSDTKSPKSRLLKPRPTGCFSSLMYLFHTRITTAVYKKYFSFNPVVFPVLFIISKSSRNHFDLDTNRGLPAYMWLEEKCMM